MKSLKMHLSPTDTADYSAHDDNKTTWDLNSEFQKKTKNTLHV